MTARFVAACAFSAAATSIGPGLRKHPGTDLVARCNVVHLSVHLPKVNPELSRLPLQPPTFNLHVLLVIRMLEVKRSS
jgi:hypothetical protein